MSKRHIPWSFIFGLLVILLLVTVLFAAFTFLLFHFFPWPTSAADFGESIGGISALFTALAFAGALYAVFLQRKALELQQQQMSKELSEVREQTKLIADRFQQIVPIGRAYDRMEATEAITEAVLVGAKKGIDEAIFYLPDSDYDLCNTVATSPRGLSPYDLEPDYGRLNPSSCARLARNPPKAGLFGAARGARLMSPKEGYLAVTP